MAWIHVSTKVDTYQQPRDPRHPTDTQRLLLLRLLPLRVQGAALPIIPTPATAPSPAPAPTGTTGPDHACAPRSPPGRHWPAPAPGPTGHVRQSAAAT